MKTGPSAEAQPNMVGDWCICVSGAKLDLFWPAELLFPGIPSEGWDRGIAAGSCSWFRECYRINYLFFQVVACHVFFNYA